MQGTAQVLKNEQVSQMWIPRSVSSCQILLTMHEKPTVIVDTCIWPQLSWTKAAKTGWTNKCLHPQKTPFYHQVSVHSSCEVFSNKAACNRDYHMILMQISDVFIIVTTTWFCLSAMCNICLWCARRAALRRELWVAWGRKPSSQVLEYVEGKTAHQSDDGDFPQER